MGKKESIENYHQSLITLTELAIDIFRSHDTNKNRGLIDGYELLKEHLINLDSKFMNRKGLSDIEDSILTFFNESSGELVSSFWDRITELDLPYRKKDKLTQILKRGRLINRNEFDFVTDTLVAMRQENKISFKEFELLSKMLEDYQNR